MAEHVRMLVKIGILRALVGIALGPILIHKSRTLTRESYGSTWVAPDVQAFDAAVLLGVGALLLAGGIARLIQAAGASRSRPWARRLGLALGVFDIANLAFFPVAMALGLYAVVVYRHPDTLDRFEPRGRASSASLPGYPARDS
jgi:hypothetical protein